MKRVRWTERTFAFDQPVGQYREVLERLRFLPARLRERLHGVATDVLVRRPPDGSWSIQEHVGHYADVEQLFLGRLQDYDENRDALRPADMSNRRTTEAHHNEREIEAVLASVEAARSELIAHLEAREAEDPSWFGRSARHPRLKRPMRAIDMMVFLAEHDDYHLARIRELLGRQAG